MQRSLKADPTRKDLCRRLSCENAWAIPKERPLLPAWFLRNPRAAHFSDFEEISTDLCS